MIISICGKSGSGKSTLAKKIIEERKNAIHIDIDKIAHQVLTIPEVKQQLEEQFKNVLTNNEVDRKKLGPIVFLSQENMDILAQITWPYMEQEIDRMINQNKDKIIILDYLLLPKTKYFEQSDIKILLDIPKDVRKERIVKRDNISEDKFNLRDSSSIEYDKEKFDYVISSDDYDIKEVLGLNKKRVLYPGSFDPITLGHMNIIEQASLLFDEVIVAVLTNSSKKNSFFTPEERVRIIKEIYKQVDNIKVVQGEGATVDLAMLYNCKAIVRGLRGLSDYDYEVQLSQINKDISNGEVNTICFFADQKYQFISSSVVKEVYNLGKDITPYVHPYVKQKMYERGE